MSELNLKHEAKRYGCAILSATIMALNIKTFVRAGGLFPGGFTGLTLLLQNIFQTFMGIAVPYTLINVLLNSIPEIHWKEIHDQLRLCHRTLRYSHRHHSKPADHLRYPAYQYLRRTDQWFLHQPLPDW